MSAPTMKLTPLLLSFIAGLVNTGKSTRTAEFNESKNLAVEPIGNLHLPLHLIPVPHVPTLRRPATPGRPNEYRPCGWVLQG